MYISKFSMAMSGLYLTFSTSVGFAKDEDKTPDTTPQNTLITIVSSEKTRTSAIDNTRKSKVSNSYILERRIRVRATAKSRLNTLSRLNTIKSHCWFACNLSLSGYGRDSSNIDVVCGEETILLHASWKSIGASSR